MADTATVDDLKRVERLIAGLDPKARRELEELPAIKEQLKRKWIPNPGPQTTAYYSPADELFYGGEAGGGKSDLMQGLAANEHDQSLLLRRTNKEASKFIKRFSEIIGHRDGWNGQLSTFRLPGQIIEFGGCEHEDDKQKYKGDPHDLIGFDEIADFTETQYRFIIGWNRSAKKGRRSRVVCCGNPPTRPEGLWVLKYWGAWLDQTHPNPAKPGELRWYTTINGVDTEVDGAGPHVLPGEPKPIIARSRTFIPAELDDNPDLEESGYDAVLAALPEELRAAYRDGRFDLAAKDDAFQVIPTHWIVAAQERWKEDGYKGLAMTAMGLDPAGGGTDAAVLAPRYGGWYAPLVAVKGPDTADGSAMAGLVVRHRKDGCPIVVDVGGGYAGAVITRFKDNGIDYHRFDGASSSTASAKGSGLRFYNKRAEAWWRFREELDMDQEGGSAIGLPPDTDLRAELASARWQISARGIQLEDKAHIRERIGRSPNKADAVVMALSEGNKAAIKRMGALGGRQPKVILGYPNAKRR